MPVIFPDDDPIVATLAFPEVHVPPVVPSLKLADAPTQIPAGPLMVGGSALTVTVLILIQPVFSIYVITAVPADIPKTIPAPVPTAATPGFPLVQVPPTVASLRLVTDPAQTLALPLIVAGNE